MGNVHDELERTGHNHAWFAAAEPQTAQAVMNAFGVLSGLDAWKYVLEEVDSTPGCCHVLVRVDELKARLNHMRFARKSGAGWEMREPGFGVCMHIKHFDGWPSNKVQIHFDACGLVGGWWWLLPPVVFIQLIRHLLTYRSYRDALKRSEQLRRKGHTALALP